MNMKKIFFALVFAALSTVGYSQAVQFGPKVGVNISNYTGGNIKSESIVGAHFGGILAFNFGNNFAIQPEVLFSTQGAKIENINGDKSEFKANYVSIPVMLKLRTNGGLYIEAGPQVAFKAGEKSGDQTINDFANGLDLALGAGIGYETKIGLAIGARYVAGLSKVGDFQSSNINPDFKNSVIQVGLYWAIPGRN